MPPKQHVWSWARFSMRWHPLRPAKPFRSLPSTNPRADLATSRLPYRIHRNNPPRAFLICNSWRWGANLAPSWVTARRMKTLTQELWRSTEPKSSKKVGESTPSIWTQLMPGSSTVQLFSHTTAKMPSPPHQDCAAPLHWGAIPHSRSYNSFLRDLEALPK